MNDADMPRDAGEVEPLSPVEDALDLLAKFDSLTISERLGLPAQIMLTEIQARAAVAQAHAAVRAADAHERMAASLAAIGAELIPKRTPWPATHTPISDREG